MIRPSCSACKSPLDPNAGESGRCPTCGSPVIYRAQPAGPEKWDAVARRDPAFSGRWVLGDPVGAGRASMVFRATAREGGEACAVKLLTGVTDPAVVHNFHSGDGTGPAVDHAGIVSPIAYGVLENAKGEEIGYLVRPFVDGHPLVSELAGGALPLARSLSIFAGVLAALQAAHRVGLVHGDPKPTDVLLTEDGQVRLVDAGCPREPLPVGAVGRPLPAGAPEYLAPEVAAGGAPSPASDIYAAGVMLLEMLTGVNPFRMATPQASLASHAGPAPVPAELKEAAPEVGALLDSALSVDPAARPECADALRIARDLARVSAARGTLLKLPLPPLARPITTAGDDASQPLRLAGSALLAAAIAGLMIFGARARVPPSVTAPAQAPVRFTPGARAMLVWLANPGVEPIRLRCWAEGTPESAAPLQPSISPPASGPLTVRIGDLKPATAYRVRVLHGPGVDDEPALHVKTLAASKDLVRSHRVTYRSGGGVRLMLDLADPELALEVSASGSPSVRTTGGPAERDGVLLTLPPQGSSDLKLVFPGLGEEVPLGTVSSARERARAISGRMAQLGEAALLADTAEGPLSLIATAVSGDGSPEVRWRRAVDALDRWMTEKLGVATPELFELANALLPDETVPMPERWLLYQTLSELAELEQSARERRLSEALWPELAPAMATLVQTERRRADGPPPDGARPLRDEKLPEATRRSLERAPLPLFATSPRPPADGRPSAALFASLAEPDVTPPAVSVPITAQVPGEGERLEVALRVAGLDPLARLIVDAGEGAVVSMRSPLSPAMPALSSDTLPERAALEPASEWLLARMPHPSGPARLRLSASRSAIATQPSASEPVWVLDLVLRRVR